MTALAAILGTGIGLEGCQAVREATGAVKQAPDEFTVLTKAPLVIPPDYNLRPPQPGVASRNEIDPDQQAQAALFAPSAADQAAALGTNYSDGEKLLLSKSQALTADANIRRTVNADAGQEDQGPAFASKVLYEGAKPLPPRVVAQPNGQVVAQAAPVETEGFFGRNFGFLGLGSSGETATQIQQPVVAAPQPAPQVIAQQPVYAPAPPVVAAPPPVYAPAPQPATVAAPQPVYAPVPQAVPAPQVVYAPAPQPATVAAPQPVYAPAPQQVAAAPQVLYAPAPQAQPAYVPAQPAAQDEQPGWFTRNFIMSPQQRAALAAGRPIPPSVTQQIEMAQQQQQLQQPVIVAAAPAPAQPIAAAPGQFVAPVVAAPSQVVVRPALQTATGPKPEPKNLYQYFFGVPPAAAATVTSVAQPVAQQQQQIILPAPPPIPQAQPQPAPPPQVQPQPAQQEKEGWWSRVFGL
jgi:hypothetical protein